MHAPLFSSWSVLRPYRSTDEALPRQLLREAGEPRFSWTAEEDAVIFSGVLECGRRWNRIAERLPRRTEHAIRNRWHRLQVQPLQKVVGIADCFCYAIHVW